VGGVVGGVVKRLYFRSKAHDAMINQRGKTKAHSVAGDGRPGGGGGGGNSNATSQGFEILE
jgi:hypothetical protein